MSGPLVAVERGSRRWGSRPGGAAGLPGSQPAGELAVGVSVAAPLCPGPRSPPAPRREPHSHRGGPGEQRPAGLGPARPAPGYGLTLLSSGAAGCPPCLSQGVIFGSPSRLVLPRPGELTGSKKAPRQSREAESWHIQLTAVSLTCQEGSGLGQGWGAGRPLATAILSTPGRKPVGGGTPACTDPTAVTAVSST